MKFIRVILIIIVCSFFSISFRDAQAQVNNRLPRKVIIDAMNNALQDSARTTIKPFVCKPNTTSITICVNNFSDIEDNPYIITVDSLGITLEIFKNEEHILNEFYEYRGSNFSKILAKSNSAKLKKVKPHGIVLDGGTTTLLSFNNDKGVYFTISDESGIRNYEGDFDGVITEIIRQIPNFQAIVCKKYDIPTQEEDVLY